jgi:hypothetical protein
MNSIHNDIGDVDNDVQHDLMMVLGMPFMTHC